MKTKKLKDLKNWINQLSEEELEKFLYYNSTEFGLSGVVEKITRIKTNLYYTGEDHPARLYTKKELKEDFDYEQEEIDSTTVELPKGGYCIEF